MKEHLFHAAGAVHGSVYFKMLDDAAWFAVNSLLTDEFVVTASFTVYLTRPRLLRNPLRSVGHASSKGARAGPPKPWSKTERDEMGRGSGTFAKSGELGPDLGYV